MFEGDIESLAIPETSLVTGRIGAAGQHRLHALPRRSMYTLVHDKTCSPPGRVRSEEAQPFYLIKLKS